MESHVCQIKKTEEHFAGQTASGAQQRYPLIVVCACGWECYVPDEDSGKQVIVWHASARATRAATQGIHMGRL